MNVTTVHIRLDPVHPYTETSFFFLKEDNYGKAQFLFFDASDLIYLTLRLSDESLFSTTAAILSFQQYIYCHLI